MLRLTDGCAVVTSTEGVLRQSVRVLGVPLLQRLLFGFVAAYGPARLGNPEGCRWELCITKLRHANAKYTRILVNWAEAQMHHLMPVLIAKERFGQRDGKLVEINALI